MKVTFEYNKEKDTWCLLNKGKSSNNSQAPTKVYELLATTYGENLTQEQTSKFIDDFLNEKGIDPNKQIILYEEDWKQVSEEYHRRAEKIFGTSLPKEITAYLTVNNRCPYSIQENYFFVSMSGKSPVIKTAMHELWHFYTWYGLGADQEQKLGKQKYNDLKEALTVLLNVVYKDFLPESDLDKGYPQHVELREKILSYWDKDPNMTNLWEYLVKLQ